MLPELLHELLPACLAEAQAVDPSPSPWLQVFGRFHIVLLHLPIGLLPGIFVLELGCMLLRRTPPRGAIATLSVLAALTAGAAFAAGLVLADEPYTQSQRELIAQHKNLAIAMTACCVLLPVLAFRKSRRPFRVALAAALALSVFAGHVGGSLTHRSDFLFKPLRRAAGSTDTDPTVAPQAEPQPATHGDDSTSTPPAETATGYAKTVAPVLKRACTSCHNDDDYEGDLDLTSRALVLEGWGDEKIVVPGKPDESILITSLLLPLDDDLHMPPADEAQLEPREIEALRRWVQAGCPE